MHELLATAVTKHSLYEATMYETARAKSVEDCVCKCAMRLSRGYNVMRHEYHTRNVQPRALNRYRRQCARPLTKELCVNLIGHGMSLNSSCCAGRLEN